MAYSFNVRGRQSLTRRLQKLPESAKREVKHALIESAELVQRDAVAMVPVDTGDLKKIISSPRAVRIRRGGLQVVFGVTGAKAGRDGFYARFVEFGTKAYKPGEKRRTGRAKVLGPVRYSKSGKKLGRKRTSGGVEYQRVKRNIPARPAQPFMRPAFDRHRQAIRERLRAAARRALAKYS